MQSNDTRSQAQPLPGLGRDHRIALMFWTPDEIETHARECDGEPGPPPYPGMNDQPCIACRASKWERWNLDPYGQFHGAARKCKRCGGDRRDASARRTVIGERKMLDGRYWPSCYECDGPIQARDPAKPRALAMDFCVDVRRGELRL